MSNKKLTNMVWRSIGEAICYSTLLLAGLLYYLYMSGYMREMTSWRQMAMLTLTLSIPIIGGGIVYGFLSSNRHKARLEQLRESMVLLEKGNLSRAVPPLGEDEIGRLGEQLNRITQKWEEQVSSLQRLSNNNAQLAQQAKVSAIVEERQRLARELHDAVSQQLFAISMTATAVGRTLDRDFEKAKRQIRLIEEMASVAQSEMRALLLHLRPIHLEGKQLVQGLTQLLQELQSKVPIEISSDMDGNIMLPRGIEDHLFRIVQEALSNALRHSKAARIDVKLHHLGDAIRLVIRDDGVGFDLDDRKRTSFGLEFMRERVNEIGGSLHVITAPRKGTRIEIRVPMIKDEEHAGEDVELDEQNTGHAD